MTSLHTLLTLNRACSSVAALWRDPHVRLMLSSLSLGLFLLVWLATLTGGGCIITREASFCLAMATSLEVHTKEHEGRLPSSWESVRLPEGVSSFDEIFPDITPTKRYAFLPQPVTLIPPHEGELVMITRRSFREARHEPGLFAVPFTEPSRYLIYRQPGGEFAALLVREEYVQAVFRGQESLLPVPDGEPLRTREARVRWGWIIYCCVMGALALPPLCSLLGFLRRLHGDWA